MSDERTHPHDDDAERAVLGGLMWSPHVVAETVPRLRPEDFYQPAHQRIYAAILALAARGAPVEPKSVATELRGDLDRVGGRGAVFDLYSGVASPASTGFYAEIVAETATRRRYIEAGTRIIQIGQSTDLDPAEAADRVQAEAYAATERRTSSDGAVRLGELLQDSMQQIEDAEARGGTPGVATGFSELDQIIGGFRPGQMWIVAARPGVGKSVFAGDVLRSCSIKKGTPAVLFSLEMSRLEITMRLLSAEAKVPLAHMRSGHMSDDDWARLARRMGEVADAPLYIDDSASLTVGTIVAKARRLKQRHGIGLVVVDYLQLMTSGKRVENRQVEVSEFSRSLKLLAKELAVPVVALSQLNRGPEQRTDKKPMVSDLRESGALEQDADGVILLHREDKHEPESPRAGEADFIVAKNRNGPEGRATVAFQGSYTRFADLASPRFYAAAAAA